MCLFNRVGFFFRVGVLEYLQNHFSFIVSVHEHLGVRITYLLLENGVHLQQGAVYNGSA